MVSPSSPQSLTRYAWLSIGASVVTIGLKSGAYWLTGSVGLLSDALEAVVNLVAAVVALGVLTIAARPTMITPTVITRSSIFRAALRVA